MPQQGNQYVVQGGDNLFAIADKVYGDQRMFAEIMRLNRLNSGIIRPGMVLTLPRQKPTSQIIVKQSTMDYIGAENKVLQETGQTPSQQQIAQQMQTGQQAVQQSMQQAQLTPEQQSMRDIASQQRAEQYQKRQVIDQQNMKAYHALPTSPYVGGNITNAEMRGRGFGAPKQTRGEYLAEQAARTKGFVDENLARGAKSAIDAGTQVMRSVVDPLGTAISTAKNVYDPIAKAWKNYMGQTVDPQTGQTTSFQVPKTVQQVPPQAQVVQTPKTPTNTTYYVSELGKTYNNGNEPLASNAIASLSTIEIRPENQAFYNRMINDMVAVMETPMGITPPVSLTQSSIEQFISTFNITDPVAIEQMNSLVDKNTIVQTTTEEEIVASLYESLNESLYDLPSWYSVSPMEVYQRGGFGGSGSGSGSGENSGGNVTTIGTGGSTTWSVNE